ncbi:MAG TPA: universal stress protein [Haliangiales bacterium]|nr:universal stress protein [Haliangiales bacterium]
MHTVSELMTPSPIVIDVHQPLAEASERMEQFRLRHLPVIDARGRLVGILSELDLYRFKDKRPRADLENMAVGAAMDPNPYTVAPDAPITSVARTMAAQRIGAAVVMNEGRVAGVFTTVDALRGLAAADVLSEVGGAPVSPTAARKVLCPIDFSPGSREAVCHALDLARGSGGSVTLFHAFDVPAVSFTPAMIEQADEQVLASLHEWRLDFQRPGEADIAVAKGIGPAWRAIVDYAKAHDYDVIVMGTHGRTGLPRMLVGSVAENVTRHAPCPVMIVRRRESDRP